MQVMISLPPCHLSSQDELYRQISFGVFDIWIYMLYHVAGKNCFCSQFQDVSSGIRELLHDVVFAPLCKWWNNASSLETYPLTITDFWVLSANLFINRFVIRCLIHLTKLNSSVSFGLYVRCAFEQQPYLLFHYGFFCRSQAWKKQIYVLNLKKKWSLLSRLMTFLLVYWITWDHAQMILIYKSYESQNIQTAKG